MIISSLSNRWVGSVSCDPQPHYNTNTFHPVWPQGSSTSVLLLKISLKWTSLSVQWDLITHALIFVCNLNLISSWSDSDLGAVVSWFVCVYSLELLSSGWSGWFMADISRAVWQMSDITLLDGVQCPGDEMCSSPLNVFLTVDK